MKKIFALCICATLLFSLFGCAPESKEHGDPNANREMPTGSVPLTISQTPSEHAFLGFGTEVDPHFLSENVGLVADGREVKASDWEDIFVPRMREMNLSRIRVMVMPHYFAPTKDKYVNRAYDWDSERMKSLYQVLDSAQQLNMYVNLTYWGADSNNSRWLVDRTDLWCVDPKVSEEEAFVEMFADLVQYLREEKGYTCVKEVTLFNEPNAIYDYYGISGHERYTALCKKMQQAFVDKGIREDVKFNLSDDARSVVWLGKSAESLQGVADILDSHSYDLGDEHTNEQMQSGIPNYDLGSYAEVLEGYDYPHMFGEFGTNNMTGSHHIDNADTPERGFNVPRIAINMINSGAVGASYWVLFNQYYNRSDFAINYIMEQGLWAFADEDYAVRPVYYSYSLLTRFSAIGDRVYPIPAGHPSVAAFALRSADDKWSYFVTNDSDSAISVSFLNETLFPETMDKYVYVESDVPTDGKQIGASDTIPANGRVLTDSIPARGFVVYSDR